MGILCYLCGATVTNVRCDPSKCGGREHEERGEIVVICDACMGHLRDAVAIKCKCGLVQSWPRTVPVLVYLSEMTGKDYVAAALAKQVFVVPVYGCESCFGHVIWRPWVATIIEDNIVCAATPGWAAPLPEFMREGTLRPPICQSYPWLIRHIGEFGLAVTLPVRVLRDASVLNKKAR